MTLIVLRGKNYKIIRCTKHFFFGQRAQFLFIFADHSAYSPKKYIHPEIMETRLECRGSKKVALHCPTQQQHIRNFNFPNRPKQTQNDQQANIPTFTRQSFTIITIIHTSLTLSQSAKLQLNQH